MLRILCLLAAFSIASFAGCPADELASVEHDNVCIDLAPDGKSVVFSSARGDLFLFDLATRRVERLTDTADVESCPSFSPDGLAITFAASKSRSAPCSVFVMQLATRGVTQVTEGQAKHDYLPRYTPDGAGIVFARAHRQRNGSLGGLVWDTWDVYSVKLDGTKATRVTQQGYYQLFRIVPKVDGSFIFAADTLSDGPSAALYSVSASERPRLIYPAGSIASRDVNAWASDPMLSSDEKLTVFTSDRQKAFWYDVCVMSGENEPRGLVGMQSRYNRYPDFFPDANRIIFLSGNQFNGGNRPVYSLWEVSLTGQASELAPHTLFTYPEQWLNKDAAERQHAPEPAAGARGNG